MSDAAFKTAPFPGITNDRLAEVIEIARNDATAYPAPTIERMKAELERRAAAKAGDVSQMTPGERLRFAKTGEAR